ncbi:hypothetical protein [Nocardia tengchongensis]
MSIIWRNDNPHPALVELHDHLDSKRAAVPDTEDDWIPTWAQCIPRTAATSN